MHKLAQFAVNRLNMKNLLFIFMLLFTIVPSVLLLTLSTVYTKSIITDNYSRKYLDTVCDTLTNNLCDTIYQLNLSSVTLSSLQSITHSLNSNMTYADKKEVIITELKDIMTHDAIIGGISIITQSGEDFTCFLNGESLRFDDTYFLSSLSKTSFTMYDRCISSGKSSYVVLGRAFFNYTTGKDIGKIIFYIKNENLYSIYSDSVLNDSTFFLTCSDTIISHTDKNKINSKLFIPEMFENGNAESDEYMISEYALDLPLYNSDVKAVSIISHADTFSLIKRIISRLWMLFLLIALLSFFISYFIAKKVSIPLSNLKNAMDKFADNIDVAINLTPSNEIYALDMSFERMVMQIKNLTRMNNIEKEKQRIAELNTLQAQISPHFVYNALDIAYCLAKLKGQTDIEEILYALATYFRLGLHNSFNYTTVENEIKHVESFLVIEKIRFPELFDVSFDIDERIKSFKMIKIIIQPIVENAIKHGFKNICYKGILTIKGCLDDNDDVVFSVSDNGVGMGKPPSLTLSEHNQNGFGLFNVNERLVRTYGADYGLKFDSKKGGGTTVSFKIKPLSEK